MLSPQARFLDALTAFYPGGIPQRLLVAQKLTTEAVPAQCQFVPPQPKAAIYFIDSAWGLDQNGAPYSGANGSLLRDIVEKGMKLDGAVALLGGNDAQVTLAQKLENHQALPILFLALQSKLTCFDKQTRGVWFDFQGRRALLSHSLSEIRSNPQSKKEFWTDLKAYMDNL